MSQNLLHLQSTLPIITTPLSLLGSSAILYVISRSKDKLSTTLNRLLVGLCVGDLIFSFPMLFSKAIIKLEDRMRTDADGVDRPVPGTTNWAACETQGFLLLVGGLLSICYNCALCVYYVCVIKMNYSDTKIKKKIEPFLHANACLVAITLPSAALATKSINPWYNICRIQEYRPKDCEFDDCGRGKSAYIFDLFIIVSMIVVFIAIIAMMAVVYLQVWRQERRMRNSGYRSSNNARAAGNETNMIAGRQNQAQANNANSGLLRQNVTNSRKVLNQGLAYAGAFFTTWFSFIVIEIVSLAGGYSTTLDLLSAFFAPLQGFFNFLVFIYPRVTRQLRGNHDLNVLQALWAAIRCTPIPPKKKRNHGGGNGTTAGAGTGRRGNGAAGTRNISGLRGTGGGNSAATVTRNISGLRGTVGGGDGAAGASATARNISGLRGKSVGFGDGDIADQDQRKQKISDSKNFAKVSLITASTVSRRSTIDEIEQEEKTEIEGTMTNTVYEEVGMFEAIESTPMEGDEVERNNEDRKDEETGLLKDKL